MARWRKPPHLGLITPHVSYAEMICRHCGKIPSVEAVEGTAHWLEQVRHWLGGAPLHITSGCRCPIHNHAVGGAPQSYHMQGMAVDFVQRGIPLGETKSRCQNLWQNGKVSGFGDYDLWVHLDRGQGGRRWHGP